MAKSVTLELQIAHSCISCGQQATFPPTMRKPEVPCPNPECTGGAWGRMGHSVFVTVPGPTGAQLEAQVLADDLAEAAAAEPDEKEGAN